MEGEKHKRLTLEELDVTLENSSVIELNVAVLNHRPAPYPDRSLLNRLERGKLVAINDDAHHVEGYLRLFQKRQSSKMS